VCPGYYFLFISVIIGNLHIEDEKIKVKELSETQPSEIK
jgi:hypothetical protein